MYPLIRQPIGLPPSPEGEGLKTTIYHYFDTLRRLEGKPPYGGRNNPDASDACFGVMYPFYS